MQLIKREQLEVREHEVMSEDAAFADETEGRDRSTQPDEYRTEYQRDRDKIVHSKAFRRLSHKTQVFIAAEGDHYRTRLTHTLEVAQISRTIARALGLNEDLTEAIAFGHDLGHTPFGHTGEDALSECIAKHRMAARSLADVGEEVMLVGAGASKGQYYRHNEQSLRVVEVLEMGGRGLNLTIEVRDGILCHTGDLQASTLEGCIVATADRIAYVNHDIDDAIRSQIICENQLPQSTHELLGSNHSARIATLVSDMIATSSSSGDIAMSPAIWDAMMELRTFLFENVYYSERTIAEEPKATLLISSLFEYFITHPDEVPAENRRIAHEHPSPAIPDDPECTAVVDYIASMTDRFARSTYGKLFIPDNWS